MTRRLAIVSRRDGGNLAEAIAFFEKETGHSLQPGDQFCLNIDYFEEPAPGPTRYRLVMNGFTSCTYQPRRDADAEIH